MTLSYRLAKLDNMKRQATYSMIQLKTRRLDLLSPTVPQKHAGPNSRRRGQPQQRWVDATPHRRIPANEDTGER